jgi:hypothetical protein
MQKKSIGYFGGTDSSILTSLMCDGHDTCPVSNGYDNHGRCVRLINEVQRYDLLIGYMHKVFAPDSMNPKDPSYQDIFHVCHTHRVPLLLLVPAELSIRARRKRRARKALVCAHTEEERSHRHAVESERWTDRDRF